MNKTKSSENNATLTFTHQVDAAEWYDSWTIVTALEIPGKGKLLKSMPCSQRYKTDQSGNRAWDMRKCISITPSKGATKLSHSLVRNNTPHGKALTFVYDEESLDSLGIYLFRYSEEKRNNRSCCSQQTRSPSKERWGGGDHAK